MYKIEFAYQRENHTNKPIVTLAQVTLPDDDILQGEAICHDLDNPVKEVGRKLALARAIASLPQAERRKVWNEYFNR